MTTTDPGPGPVVWPGEDHRPRDLVRRAEPRVVRAIVLIVLGCFTATAIMRLVYVADYFDLGAADFAIGLACIVGVLALQLTVLDRPQSQLSSPIGYAALVTQAALTYVPMFVYLETWAGMPGFVAASALLVLRSAVAAWLFFATAVAASAAHQIAIGFDVPSIAVSAASTLTVGLIVYGVYRLSSLVAAIQAARTELAEVAVAKERLRVARDLHDLLGYSFSAITLKSELAHRLIDRNPARADGELVEVLEISRQALTDVRAVASGYRDMALDEELESARAVLRAAEIDTTVDADDLAWLAPAVETTLATVLREAVTNVLRHSAATRCGIAATRSAGVVTLEIVNDGASGVADSRDGDHAIGAVRTSGSGLGNLAARIELLGGSLTAGHEPHDRFRVVATLPA